MEIRDFSFRDFLVDSFVDAVKLYFLPLRGWRPLASELRQTQGQGVDQNALVPLSLISSIRSVVCKNQGLVSEYWYKAGEKHKLLKEEFNSSTKDREKIASLAKELVSDLNIEMFKAFQVNFKLMHEIFDERDKVPPRICVKGFFKTENDDRIVTVVRDSLERDDHITAKGSNSGFEHVISSGRYFFCNNVPRAAFRGKYRNPRLNYEEINKSKKSLFKKSWSKYWLDGNLASQYGSTLIVPMTFWNNEFNDGFARALDVLPNSKRTIFGFLCIDHPNRNYFTEELDVSIGYMFADFLSMYMYSRTVFIEISKTYSEVDKFLKSPEVEIEFDKLLADLREIMQKQYKPRSVRDIEESTEAENRIWRFDEELLNFVDGMRKAGKEETKDVLKGTLRFTARP